MKENGSMAGKVLNRNWLMKRKRRKIPYGIDTCAGKQQSSKPLELLSNTSSIRRLKNEKSSEHPSSKRKGDDGYYYECEVCDIGGDLLCCDSCPRTYHIECLDPPLKRIPTGKWECPQCYARSNMPESVTQLDPISKRARTKIIIGKSKSANKSSEDSKVPQLFGSVVIGKKRSSSKEKSSLSPQDQVDKKLDSNDVSCSNKPNHPSPDISVEGNSSCASIDDGKKAEVFLVDEPAENKSVSPAKEVLTSLKIIGPKRNGGTVEGKQDLSCNKRSVGIEPEPILALEAEDKKAKKRDIKHDVTNSKKKRRTDKDRCAADTSKKRGSKVTSACPGTSKLHRKRKIVDHEGSANLGDQGSRKDVIDIQLKDEVVTREAAGRLSECHGSGKIAVETLTNEDNVPEVQQVDRVLGCRVQGDKTTCSDNIPVIDSIDPPPEDMQVLEDLGKQPEENPTKMPSAGIEEEEFTEALQDIQKFSDEMKNKEFDSKMEKLLVYKRSVTKECKEGTGPDSANIESESSDSKMLNIRNQDDPLDDTGDLLSPVKEISAENNSACLEGDESGPVLKSNRTPFSHEIGGAKEAGVVIAANSVLKESSVSEAASINQGTVSYEFLVKWVGKSHIHNRWITESELKVLAKRKLDNYKGKYGIATINLCEERWKQPQRIIAVRSCNDGSDEVFVKWTGLSYDECTWEKISEPVISNSSHLIDLYNQFERQALDKDCSQDELLCRKSVLEQSDIVTLAEQPTELQGGSLFPHQLEALNWLRKCWHKSKNVILADEMGLGKTVSACAFISSLYFEFKARLPCLVLVPLSTMPNWMSEFSLWAPNLNVVEYHGSAKARTIIRQYEWHASDPSQRTRKAASYKFNVLLTTYEMVLADYSHLRGVPWEVLVVDEGHRLKNSSSKLFSLLNTFSFQHRVLLTGTPLQNNIGEMYNLLNFLQPASFPSLSSFEEKFNDLTTAEKVDELKKLVAPHMLRRLKKDAMQNIPPKTERMVPVELSSIQAEYYRAMLTKNYQILRNIGKGAGQQSMLNIVMQLRKVCNHPYLIPGTEPESGSVEFLHEMRIKASAKLTLLHSMLKILHKQGHRVLLFSQMTKLLDILEDYLTIEFGPKTFERVDGSVSVADRQAAITRFNQDKSRFVFLLSTRSCGLGINLATADTVIIYDSDFNPHADIQAMNRAHRIGQSNRLLVYRLVVRASVEERILQLAKKKLMLDQLFVNKSGSQKEVEDILRWGTEELFRDSPSMAGKDGSENNGNKDEVIPEIEHKHRRKTGSLGDVYKDRCTDGSNKIVWDENAILKLLDRSNIQSGSPDNAEEPENDMLGSVKSMEWNEESPEEHGPTSSPAVTDDMGAQNSEKKEDNLVGAAEENEWDRLLRVRWEKYQSEEEAALGRGKRQRKAVSYREAYAPHAGEALSENGAEEEHEPEPEPEREYTPAGRALKAKYTKLRARQKERLARRSVIEARNLIGGLSGPDAFPQLSQSHGQEGNPLGTSVQPIEEKTFTIDLEENRSSQTPEGTVRKTDSSSKLGKISKQKFDVHPDTSVRPTAQHFPNIGLLNHRAPGTSSMNLMPSNNLSPVLGLCAPNATQRNYDKAFYRQSRQDSGPDFPFPVAPCSGTLTEMGADVHAIVTARHRLPDISPDALQQHANNNLPDSYLASNAHPSADLKGKGRSDLLENPGASFSEFQEKLVLPKLPLDDNLLPRYPFPAKNLPPAPHDFFPGLSLGPKVIDGNKYSHDFPPMPLLPNLKFLPHEISKYNRHEQEKPPLLGLGQMPPFSSFPDNHRKVLENIMLRTGSGSGNLVKKKSRLDIWSEDELDYLWIGVRRHGRGNWNAMLQDPRLKFSKFKTPEDLSGRWEEEQLKILDGPVFPFPKPLKATKSAKSSLLSGISDGMMTRALHGSKLNGPLKFQGHLTDMKLGFGDLPSSLPHVEPTSLLGLSSDQIPSFPPSRANFSRDFAAGPSDRFASSSGVQTDSPFLLNSFGTSCLDSLGLNSSNSFGLREKENDRSANLFGKFPSFLDRPSNPLPDLRDLGNDESRGSALLSDLNKVQDASNLKGKEVIRCNSPKDNLPHWLREAVNAPTKPPALDLPPTVSAIAQSVRLLYGEGKSKIPPFVVPGPPPSQPKDPRRSLMKKKRQKTHKAWQPLQDPSGPSNEPPSSLHNENVTSSSVLRDLPFPVLPKSTARTSPTPCAEPNLITPPLNLNAMDPSSSSANCKIQKKNTSGLSPSPEVLQLVASCAAPGSISTGNSSFPKTMLPHPESVEQDKPSELQNIVVEEKSKQGLGPWSPPLQKGKQEQTESADSSKTHSDPACARQPDVNEEVSSEGTVSDNHVSDRD